MSQLNQQPNQQQPVPQGGNVAPAQNQGGSVSPDASQGGPRPTSQDEAVAGGQVKGTVLIADDDITLRDMYQTRLETDGYQVLVAADGEEALGLIKDKKPQVVLLDIMMPKMNGLDVLAEMKKDAEMKKLPVIILTALIQDLTKVKSLMGGIVTSNLRSL